MPEYMVAKDNEAPAVRSLQRQSFSRRANTDEVKLLMLGYRQELAREFTWLNSFGSAFNAQSILTSFGGSYGTIGMLYGGPRVMMWGWLAVTLLTCSVAVSLAELSSAYPTSGAMYYWSFKLAPPRLRNLACWLTAWLSTAWQGAFSGAICYTFVYMAASALQVQYGIQLTGAQRFAGLLATLAMVGLLSCGPARLTAYMTSLGALWHIVSVAALCIALPVLAPARESAQYIFTSWQHNYDVTGISSPVYTTLIGLLMAQSTYTGYDGPAHIAEETLSAELTVPRSILLSVGAVSGTGFALLLALTAVRLEGGAAALFDPANETRGGNAVLQLLIEACRKDGGVSAAVALYSIFIVGTFFAAYQAVANSSRMVYALGRDQVLPLSGIARRLHPGTKAPVAAVCYLLVLAALLGLPMCFNTYAYNAIVSFLVLGAYSTYAMPILCKLSTGRRYFLPGPFTLGPRLSYANNVASLLWVAFVTVIFSLPQMYPITSENLNWAAPLLGFVLLICLAWYYCPKYGAVHWFVGPRGSLGQFQDVLPSMRARAARQLEEEEAAAAAAAEKAARAAAAAAEMVSRVMDGRTSGGGRRDSSAGADGSVHGPGPSPQWRQGRRTSSPSWSVRSSAYGVRSSTANL